MDGMSYRSSKKKKCDLPNKIGKWHPVKYNMYTMGYDIIFAIMKDEHDEKIKIFYF